MWRISTLGLELFGSIIGMFLLGWLLDVWLGTGNTFKLIGLGVGFVGGFWNFFKEVKDLRANPVQGMDVKKASKPPPDSRPLSGTPAPLSTPIPADPAGRARRPGRDPQLFAREHFTDEQLERIEEEGEIRWPEGFEASPTDDLPDDLDDDEDAKR